MEELINAWHGCLKVVTDFSLLKENSSTMIVGVSLFLILFGSASWASSIAEDRNHNRLSSFLFGFILPIAYPAIILFTMGLKGQEDKKVSHEATASDEDELYGVEDGSLFGDAMVDYNEEYFRGIYLDKTGKHTGPYLIEMDGDFLNVERITEVTKQFIVVERLGEESKSQTLRVPYHKIYNCTIA